MLQWRWTFSPRTTVTTSTSRWRPPAVNHPLQPYDHPTKLEPETPNLSEDQKHTRGNTTPKPLVSITSSPETQNKRKHIPLSCSIGWMEQRRHNILSSTMRIVDIVKWCWCSWVCRQHVGCRHTGREGWCRVGMCAAAPENKFERFLFFLGNQLADSNSIFVVLDFFEGFEFLVCSKFNYTHNVAVHVHVLRPVCTHTVPFRMLWCL